jgi:glycosyltransferase involved in cell wall biosynthesis
MPVVSIVLPTYNRTDDLGRAIGSVLDQRFANFELVVVDDGSSENTRAVLERFDDERIEYIEHGINRGGSAARNTGIEASSGEYIAFLDDDDAWLPDKLGRQIEELEARPEEWVGVYCDFEVVRHGVSSRLRESIAAVLPVEIPSHRPEGGTELLPTVLMGKFPLGGTSTLLVRRTAIDRLGRFDPTFQRHQDWELLVRLLRIGKIACVDEELVVKHESNQSPATAVKAAKRRFFAAFSAEIERAEQNGYDVTGAHRLELARYYFMDERFLVGTWHLYGARIEPLALAQALSTGIYSRIAPDS